MKPLFLLKLLHVEHYIIHLSLIVYGNVNIVQVMRDENGNSRGFGFVSFEEHEAAVKVR